MGRHCRKLPAIPSPYFKKSDILFSVKAAVELTGGLGIKKGSTVLIRPNANTADLPPGSTNSEVLKGAIRAAQEYNPGKVIVAEKSMTTLDTEKVLKELGLWQVAEAEGVDEILTFDQMKRRHVEPKGAYSWQYGFDVPEFLESIDYTIALPVIKDSLDCNVYDGPQVSDKHHSR